MLPCQCYWKQALQNLPEISALRGSRKGLTAKCLTSGTVLQSHLRALPRDAAVPCSSQALGEPSVLLELDPEGSCVCPRSWPKLHPGTRGKKKSLPPVVSLQPPLLINLNVISTGKEKGIERIQVYFCRVGNGEDI